MAAAEVTNRGYFFYYYYFTVQFNVQITDAVCGLGGVAVCQAL